MKKKLLVAVAASVIGSTAMAQSAFEGFYGQVGVGYESSKEGFSDGTVSSSGNTYTINSSTNNSFTGSVGIGAYFPVTKTFLLGAGAEYSPIASTSSNYTLTISDGTSVTGSSKKQNSYNIFLSPAYVIDKNKLAYAKVGYTGLSSKSTDNSDGSSATENYTGYSLGLGYKQIITGGIYAFGEVNYASYSSKALDTGVTGTVKPETMNALVGVGYKY